MQLSNDCTSTKVNNSREVITIDQNVQTLTSNVTVKDPISTINSSNNANYSNKELRQKEIKLKKEGRRT